MTEVAAAWAALPSADVALALAAVLVGYVVLGLSGFGSALVIVPLLAWRWPLTLVVPLVLLLDAPAAAWHARRLWAQVARSVAPLCGRCRYRPDQRVGAQGPAHERGVAR